LGCYRWLKEEQRSANKALLEAHSFFMPTLLKLMNGLQGFVAVLHSLHTFEVIADRIKRMHKCWTSGPSSV